MTDNGILTRLGRGLFSMMFLTGTFLFGGGCASGPKIPPPPTVLHVDLERYAGHWYELARYPNRFQMDCVGVTADYSPREDGKIDVLNMCWRGSFDGKKARARGVAKVVDKESNAKLKVTFFWPFYGDYWIIMLDPEYSWAVVSHPSREYLWILCRTKAMDEPTYAGILDQLQQWGFDTSKLIRTEHAGKVAY